MQTITNFKEKKKEEKYIFSFVFFFMTQWRKKYVKFSQCFDMESSVSDSCSSPKKLKVLIVLFLVVPEDRHGRIGDSVGHTAMNNWGGAHQTTNQLPKPNI